MTSLETSNTKVSINELSFPPVTHTAYYDVWFDRYRILKSGHGAGQILDRLVTQVSDQV
jgi:hypothetical protein